MVLNKVMLIGNLTKDPELKYIPNGTAVVNMNLAMNRTWKDKVSGEKKEDVCFAKVVVWGRRAEVCSEYLKKGNPVFIEGHLQSRSWEQDGQKRYALDVVAENVQFLAMNPKAEAKKDVDLENATPVEEIDLDA